jgi:hypothetical protein
MYFIGIIGMNSRYEAEIQILIIQANETLITGSFFRGAYLPQKSELVPPPDREGMPVQKYVPSYLTKFNPIWFK